VTLCKDAFAAIAAIKKVQPDAVLVDLVMPGRHGLDLLYHIRSWGSEHGGDVPGIIITGLRDPELENEIRNARFGYLAKPFTPIKLINTVTQALGSLALLKQPLAPLSHAC
jgi:CheY-like chemotaxis protein